MKFFRLIAVITFALIAFSGTVSAQKVFIDDANKAYKEEKFFEAIELYKKAYSKEKSKAVKSEIIFQIAECYRQSLEPKLAETWYKKAIKAKYPDPTAIFHLAMSLKVQGKYPEAIVEFNNYKAENPSDPRAEHGIKSSEEAQKWIDEPTRFVVNPEIQLNSKQYDLSPTFADSKGNYIIFTSTREGSTGKDIDGILGENFADLFESKRDKNGKWSTPTPLSGEVNTPASEGTATVDKKGKVMYFTRCNVEKNKNVPCKIYMATKKGNNWADVTLIELGPDSVSVGHPTLSADDSYMVFSAVNMEGGMGGRDLWITTYDKKSKTWGTPVNLGSSINTEHDEVFPFLHPDGSLYFSSNGYLGMGGLDVFKAEKKSEGKWHNVTNMKFPINSPADDFGIAFEGDKDRGFFSSNREGAMGGDDIFSFVLPPLIFVLQGTITDVETREPLADAIIKLVGSDGSSAEVKTDKTGKYIFGDKGNDRYIKSNTSYQITVSRQDYLNAKGKETTVGLIESTIFERDFALQTTKKKEITFPEVLYDLAQFTLRPESKDSLDFLYQTLIDNPTIIIELSAHTDSRGSDKSNMTLSDNRAKSCVDYLVSRGIPSERMIPRGYGKTRPLITDAEIAKLASTEEKEAAHQKNRRTVFSVIRTDYVPEGGFPEPVKSDSEEEEDDDEEEEDVIKEDPTTPDE
jgi:peptidoglycan-associated lipoprotein